MAQSVKTTTKPSVKVRLSIRAGINDRGKLSRSYVQQITGKNVGKVASRNGQVYDWTVENPPKSGRTEADESGRFTVKYDLGDGIYRVVQPTPEFKGWPETIFVKIAGGKVERIDQNAARAAFGLPPVTVGKVAAKFLVDDDDDVSL